jgi:hypothetical protein
MRVWNWKNKGVVISSAVVATLPVECSRISLQKWAQTRYEYEV